MPQRRRRLRPALAGGLLAVSALLLTGGTARAGPPQWTVLSSPNSTIIENSYLNAVSCVTASFCMAAGIYGTATTSQTLTEMWTGTNWTRVSSPDTSSSQYNMLSGVSCVSATFCMAVGNYYNGTVNQTLTEQWNGSSWSVVNSPSPVSGTNDFLKAVSCRSPTFCMAAGWSGDGDIGVRDLTLTEEWNGAGWSLVSSGDAGDLSGVSCTSASFCMAAGGNDNLTLTEQWNGSNWTLVGSPNPPITTGDFLHATSCTSPTFCQAAGQYGTPAGIQTMTEQWNGSWTLVSSPTLNNALYAVSCAAASFCMAAGYYNTGISSQTLIEQWNGTSWSMVSSPDTSGAQNSYLYGVSCASASFCMAVGYYFNGAHYQTLTEMWNGTSWAKVNSPNTISPRDNLLSAVSCTSATFCMATGRYYTGTAYQSLTEEWNGASWSMAGSPDTSPGQDNYLNGVSCASASFCMTVGFYNTGTAYQTLAEEWNGASWSIVTSPDTSPAQYNVLSAVSCASVSFCMATGYYNSGTVNQTLAEEWNGVSWILVTSPGTSPGQSNLLQGVNCPSAAFCMSVGNYLNGTAYQTLTEMWNGASWTVPSSPNALTPDFLSGVSCTSATFCMAAGRYYNAAAYQTLTEGW